jgi:hypothetical protein
LYNPPCHQKRFQVSLGFAQHFFLSVSFDNNFWPRTDAGNESCVVLGDQNIIRHKHPPLMDATGNADFFLSRIISGLIRAMSRLQKTRPGREEL